MHGDGSRTRERADTERQAPEADIERRGASPWTHRLPRWAWSVLTTIVLGVLVATMAVSNDRAGPGDGDPGGGSARPQVVGGRSATAGEFPFAAALVRSDRPSAHAGLFCGGSLIGPDLVLTAAHCVDGASPAQIDVLAGTHDLASGGTRLAVEAIHRHPGHDPATATNDVAVLELSGFAPGAVLVDVADPTTAEPAPGTTATVVGWGSTKVAGYPSVLRVADVPVIADGDCRASYGGRMVEARMICAGDDSGTRDACDGDSGGPLTVEVDGRPLLVGVVSWGYGCALPGFPGVYTQVGAPGLHDFLAPWLVGLRDIPAWADDAITWMLDEGHAMGYPDRLFRPDQSLTRAQAVQMLFRIAADPARALEGPHDFSDVPAWIDEAVRWAATDPDGAGPAPSPMSGYPDGTFRPNDQISRAAFSRVLWRLAGSPPATPHGFADVPAWVSDSVSWLAAEGHADGWPDGTFRPDGSITRAQASRMLFRIHG